MGGHDEAFPQTEEAVDALSEAVFGNPIKRVASREILGEAGAAGVTP